jgi:predicted RNase H-like HicB family nuclease
VTRYLIVIETTASGFSAYSPDLPGCVSTGATMDEVCKNMQEAIRFHIDGLRLEGQPVPSPMSSASYVDVTA